MLARVVLIKLAAIGDVALAARAVREFAESHEGRLELHWIIDAGLTGLAGALLGDSVDVHWHPVDATALFQGTAAAKARESLRMASRVFRTRADMTILLHRDWRYRALLGPLAARRLIAIDRGHHRELEVYRAALGELGRRLSIPESADGPPRPPDGATATGTIGLLVGGARSQKLDFAEKRWTRFSELAALLLRRSHSKIVLFGDKTDRPLADRLIETVRAELGDAALEGRIENLAGTLPLEKIPAALATLDSFVSVDSGLAHIASSVMRAPHQRVVTLFGPTDPGVWAPAPSHSASVVTVYKAAACSPCYANDGSFLPCRFEGEHFQHCMTSISAEDVFNALT